MSAPAMIPALDRVSRYAPTRHPAPCDLDLSGTELPPVVSDNLADTPTATRDGYPDDRALTDVIAAMFGIAAAQIVVTAGADDALARVFRATLTAGCSAVLTTPTFEMLPRFALLTGADVREVPWLDGPLPVAEMLAAATADTTLIAVVTPNNPTGTAATIAALTALALARPGITLVVDLAYIEFADTDPTPALLALPNVVITRTLSKAWGLPGRRVGYALGPARMIDAMRRAGLPYPVSTASLDVAVTTLRAAAEPVKRRIDEVRRQRIRLSERLETLELSPMPSQANFVTLRGGRARWIGDGLAGLGIRGRTIAQPDGDLLRLCCPVWAPDALARLGQALEIVARPEALLFDMDGVLADVSGSYRRAIVATGAAFGVTLTSAIVDERKARGNANDDWSLTHELIAGAGIPSTLEEVTGIFEALYQGTPGRPGLRASETLLPSRELLASLAARYPLAVVTGRPRRDAECFLREQRVDHLFAVVVAREDAALKPDPAPVRAALARLGVRRAWLFGDTPDDIVAARLAGVVPVGMLPPGCDPLTTTPTLLDAGAARVITSLQEILPCLPR